jgi:tetraacyldisaccharide 4'-kinase
MKLAERLVATWYAPRVTPLAALLWPLSLLFRIVVAVRRGLYGAGILRSQRLPVPVIVVGNITVGGVGKTPLTRALAEHLSQRGFKPGIVSRGYGGTSVAPRAVAPGDDPKVVGDEPLLLAETGLPVWIGHNRAGAGRGLIRANPSCDVIVADDGLQHYALARAMEIAVIDASREFGNGLMLPAGPLREPVSRLRDVDAVVLKVEILGRKLVREEPDAWIVEAGAGDLRCGMRVQCRFEASMDPELWVPVFAPVAQSSP